VEYIFGKIYFKIKKLHIECAPEYNLSHP